ncbi:MAG: hypothetical protein PVJ46_03995 [Methyloceanibacter sp.]|jgi:hypothetical protein
MGILDMWKAVRGQTSYPSGKDAGVPALDVELKCLDASERIRAFNDPQESHEAREDYARLVSDAVREAFAIEQEADRDIAFRYIIDVSCNAKDFGTAEALLTKIVSEENRQSASRAVSEARLQNTPQ